MRSRHTRATAGRIGDIGGEASIVTGDLTTEAGMQQAVAHAEARFGRLDIAFNNLGDFAFHTLAVEATSEAPWDYSYSAAALQKTWPGQPGCSDLAGRRI